MKTHEWKQGSSGRKSGGTDDENVPRDSGVGHGSRYRDFDHKRRGHSDYRDGHYQNSSRRRYEDHTPDGYRRYYDNDDHVRHHRYADRDYYSESRSYRGSRQNHRSYDDDRDDYEESRSYRGGRYEEVTKYRRTVDHYDDRDQYSDRYDRYDRYDGYRHSRRSFSPQTPYSDRRSPNPRKVYYSPPPPPPKEPPAKHAQPSDSAQQKPAKTKGGGNQESGNTGRNAAKSRPESKAAETAEATDDGKIADPRVGRNLYAARMTTALDIVTLPKVPPSESSLDSPPFELGTHWNAIKPGSNFFCTPLERINAYLCSSRCELVQEWWLKGTLSLLMMGIPRHWRPSEVLVYIMEAYEKLLDWDEVIPDSMMSACVDVGDSHKLKGYHEQWWDKIGLQKFVLLFGDSGIAVNELPLMFPKTGDTNSKTVVNTDPPDAMGLLIFNSEIKAMQFWATFSTNAIRSYPSTIVVCPDPSGWRIYTEAIALWFNAESLTQVAQAQLNNSFGVNKANEDLLSVLTNKSQDDHGPKQKPISQLTFVSPYVACQEDANQIANALTKSGIKCMYHKPSKIMSLQFPNESCFSSMAVCHRFFISPSGSRVHCCFINCLNKFLPLVKRTNVEHISNAVEKCKTTPPKPCKFKPPSVGIVAIKAEGT